MRLFVSIDIPEPIKKELHQMLPALPGWKKTEQQQLYLTLLFLGEYSSDEANEIREILKTCSFSRFSVELSHFGMFPNQQKPRVFWAGINKSESLLSLQSEIADKLSRFSKSADHVEYVPHITLARRKNRRAQEVKVEDFVDESRIKYTFSVESFELKESILKANGSVHRVLERYFAINASIEQTTQ